MHGMLVNAALFMTIHFSILSFLEKKCVHTHLVPLKNGISAPTEKTVCILWIAALSTQEANSMSAMRQHQRSMSFWWHLASVFIRATNIFINRLELHFQFSFHWKSTKLLKTLHSASVVFLFKILFDFFLARVLWSKLLNRKKKSNNVTKQNRNFSCVAVASKI